MPTKKASSPSASTSDKKPNLKKLSVLREPLSNAGDERALCKLCGLCSKNKKNRFALPVVPENYSGALLVVTEGSEDADTLKFTRRLWRRTGWTDSDVALVPAVRCGTRKPPGMVNIRACRPFLLQVITKLKPKSILALGDVAMRALRNSGEKNITKARGKSIQLTLSSVRDVPPKRSAKGRI